jgi:hypothetical protein
MSRILTLLSLFITTLAAAQLVNDGSVIVMGNGAKLYSSANIQQNYNSDTAFIILYSQTDSLVTDGTFINSGIVSSNGTVKIAGAFSNLNTSIAPQYGNNGTLILGGSFSNEGSYFIDGDGGTVRFENGAAVTMDPDTASLFNRIEIAGGNEVRLIDGVAVDTLDLQSGVLNTDTVIVSVLEHIPDFSASSYVQGVMLRVIKSGDYDFPLGVGTKFRPLTALGVTDSTWVAVGVGENYAGIFPESGLLRDVAEGVFWSYTADSASYQNTPMKFAANYTSADMGSMSGNFVIAGGDQALTSFSSYGGTASASPYAGMLLTASVDSLPFTGIIAIGESCEGVAPRADIVAYLEGPFNSTSGTMDNMLGALLDVQYIDGGLASETMSFGKTIPTNAVDVIDVYLRDATSPYSYVDTAKAWLLTDGSILDFETGTKTYVEFCDAALATPYYIEVDHRNHLPLMSSSTNALNSASSTQFDLTLANGAGIWGTGYKTVTYNSGPMDYSAMIAGDGYGQTLEVINSGDYAWVLLGIRDTDIGYLSTDVNLDGAVSANDNNIVQPNSVYLLKSSNP